MKLKFKVEAVVLQDNLVVGPNNKMAVRKGSSIDMWVLGRCIWELLLRLWPLKLGLLLLS